MTDSPADRALAEREAQGLPAHPDDELVYERVATVLRNVAVPAAAKRRKAS